MSSPKANSEAVSFGLARIPSSYWKHFTSKHLKSSAALRDDEPVLKRGQGFLPTRTRLTHNFDSTDIIQRSWINRSQTLNRNARELT
jgi:hypothetical protein